MRKVKTNGVGGLLNLRYNTFSIENIYIIWFLIYNLGDEVKRIDKGVTGFTPVETIENDNVVRVFLFSLTVRLDSFDG